MFEMEITIFCVCQHVHNLEIWVNWVFLKHLPFSWCAIPTPYKYVHDREIVGLKRFSFWCWSLMCYTYTFCVSDHVKPRNIFPSDVGPQQFAKLSYWLFSVFVGSITKSFYHICHLATHKVSISFMNSPKQDQPSHI